MSVKRLVAACNSRHFLADPKRVQGDEQHYSVGWESPLHICVENTASPAMAISLQAEAGIKRMMDDIIEWLAGGAMPQNRQSNAPTPKATQDIQCKWAELLKQHVEFEIAS